MTSAIRMIVLGLTGLAVLSAGGSALAVKKAKCPSGFRMYSTSSQAYCAKQETSRVKRYYNYTPCVWPGVYNTNDEDPSGRDRGRDRCTVPGGIGAGPALGCGLGQSIEIRRGRKDRCYKYQNQQSTRYADVIVFG